MIARVALVALWLACAGSFATARGRQFVGEPTRPMRLTATAGAIVSLIQLMALLVLPVRWTHAPAGALYFAALGLFWWSARTTRPRPLGLAFGAAGPSHLVVTGPYRYVRHPYYLSYLLFWGAGVLPMGLWGLAPLLIMGWLYRGAAAHDEAHYAASELADAYDAYRRRTGAFWPAGPVAARKSPTQAAGESIDS